MATKKGNQKEGTSVTNFHNFVSFADVGGLTDHIRTLKEMIIFPLVYQNVYNKFKIRAPRGVIFYGPPGTGKTLLAGALAKECSKEVNEKVAFFSRKGADILNKWVGESEEKLRNLFNEAAEKHPSIIFFDEIDGLAPVRSSKQDQVHASVVATLLALMDGLDKLPGVVVIGATNRIDAIDPALRRPGRFDKELYFPLPAYTARREILEVHVSSWTSKPKPSFISYLADITAGYSGSDIQALCSEAVMSCLRRNYPQIHNGKINIRMKNLKVNENDFMTARNNITPSANREENHMRRLSSTLRPLLERQLNQVVVQLKSMSPHFTSPGYKYTFGVKRFSSKLLLLGGPNQGHNNHIAPALLHALEHLPSYVIDIQALYKSANRTAEEICVQKLTQARLNLPSIVLTYRLDEWWDIVEESTRAILVSMFKDLHAGLPLLLVVTASKDLPACLMNFFSEPGSIVYVMENPNEEERGSFFYPLFMEIALNKIRPKKTNYYQEEYHPIHNRRMLKCNIRNNKRRKRSKSYETDSESSGGTKRKCSFKEVRVRKMTRGGFSDQETFDDGLQDGQQTTWSPFFNFAKRLKDSITNLASELKKCSSITDVPENEAFEENELTTKKSCISLKKCDKKMSKDPSECDFHVSGDSKISNVERIKYLYRRTVTRTSKCMAVAQLELLYDMLATCINRENQDVSTMLENISSILTDFESRSPEGTSSKVS